MPILEQKNHLFNCSSFRSCRVCKKAKFFFENEQEEAVTVNGDRSRAVLNEFLFTKIEKEDIGNISLEKDSATCHTTEATLDILCSVFEDRIIS